MLMTRVQAHLHRWSVFMSYVSPLFPCTPRRPVLVRTGPSRHCSVIVTVRKQRQRRALCCVCVRKTTDPPWLESWTCHVAARVEQGSAAAEHGVRLSRRSVPDEEVASGAPQIHCPRQTVWM